MNLFCKSIAANAENIAIIIDSRNISLLVILLVSYKILLLSSCRFIFKMRQLMKFVMFDTAINKRITDMETVVVKHKYIPLKFGVTPFSKILTLGFFFI